MRAETALLGIVMLLGSALRLAPLLTSDFPLNDGALFLSMARDLAANGMILPETTTYNAIDAPFAYPPGGPYLIAVLEGVGVRGIEMLRWLPILFSIATIPLAYAIGRELFKSAPLGLATAAFFAVSTGSYEWLILGGGVTRAPGFLLALLTVLGSVHAYRQPGRRWPVATGVALGATGLWHPQAALFAGMSVVILLLFVASDRRIGLRKLVVMAGIGAAVIAPWLAVVVARHGIDPLLSAASSGGTPFVGVLAILSSRTSAGHFEILGIATTFALVISAARGWWLPAAWMVAIVVVDSRAGQPYVALPAALAIAFALADVRAVLNRHLDHTSDASTVRPSVLLRRTPMVIGAVLFAAAFADSLAAQSSVDTPLRSVPAAEREAMTWASVNTAADATFVVVSGRYWAVDASSEWFPVLADRQSLATVQGHEWIGASAYRQQQERSIELPGCVANSDLPCIDRWLADAGKVDYLFLVTSPDAEAAGLSCCLALAEQVQATRSAQVVYRTDDVIIVQLSAG